MAVILLNLRPLVGEIVTQVVVQLFDNILPGYAYSCELQHQEMSTAMAMSSLRSLTQYQLRIPLAKG
ncbi:hypothetical protein PanWU01x14_344480 [Parasponia andersonii]|uniref:Uncharacterized protein n=1 Tax=Parasponia andersonii TaxID=3476 RepID=A0A2P5ACZ8_PARAD|nr:hypothetical protein PanWU01x14_344480 [Parasponia andersonii]